MTRTLISGLASETLVPRTGGGPSVPDRRVSNELPGMPPERVPIDVDRCATTSAASTLILLAQHRYVGQTTGSDLVVSLWIEAGNGATHSPGVVTP